MLSRIALSSNSDTDTCEGSYAGEDLDDLLEELALDEKEELNPVTDSSDHIQWNEFDGRQQSFTFTGKSGLLMDLPSDIRASVFSLFLDENFISHLVTVTNRYAEQKLQQETTDNARFNG